MNREDLWAALRVRPDTASERAASAIQRGARISEGWETSAPLSWAMHFSANDNNGADDPQVETFGHEGSMSALRACPLPVVKTISLEDVPNERWFIHLDPDSREVVACHGIVHAPNPPTPVYNREDIPGTVADVAVAFTSHRLFDGQPRPYEVKVVRELELLETEQLHASWPRRRSGFYSQAPQIKILGGAEVRGHDPKGTRFSGYLLIIDVPADPQVKRHQYGRVDALLLTPDPRGGLQLLSCMPFQYRTEPED